jgi:HD-GYP domain-containing protein (c-di-GMP phosphodiesterase class II)
MLQEVAMAIVIKSVSELTEGQILGKAIFDENGNELLSNGTELSKRMIGKIGNVGIDYVHIMDNVIDLFDRKEEKVTRFYESTERTKKLTKEIISDIINDDTINLVKYKKVIRGIFNDILTKDAIILNLDNLKSLSEYYFEHAINSTVLAVGTCLVLGLNRNLIEKIAMGIIIHDIGYNGVPKELLSKKDKLTDEEYKIMQNHVKIGYDMVEKSDEISEESIDAILYHHENIDGTGYPKGLKGNEIPLSAKLCAISDVYDALLSNREYRVKLNRYQATKILILNVDVKFDKYIIKNFLKIIGHYPLGTNVILSNGYRGVIEKESRFKPIIRLTLSNNGQAITTKEILDLSKSDIKIYDIDYKKEI